MKVYVARDKAGGGNDYCISGSQLMQSSQGDWFADNLQGLTISLTDGQRKILGLPKLRPGSGPIRGTLKFTPERVRERKQHDAKPADRS